eukprot:74316-Pelagomonas_calceolata.AAC.2
MDCRVANAAFANVLHFASTSALPCQLVSIHANCSCSCVFWARAEGVYCQRSGGIALYAMTAKERTAPSSIHQPNGRGSALQASKACYAAVPAAVLCSRGP